MTLDYLCSRFVYRDNASDYPLNTESKLILPQPCTDYKQLLDEVFVISGIIKVEVSVISRSRRLRLITLTETLIISDITKTESNNCFIIHCFKENNDKRIIAASNLTLLSVNMTLLLEIMHCARNLQIIH